MKKWIITGALLALSIEWLSLAVCCYLAALGLKKLILAAAEREV